MLKALLVLALLMPAIGGAHVKWFSDSWDPTAAPVGFARLLSSHGFVALFPLTLLVVAAAQSMDGRLAARRAIRRFLTYAELRTSTWVPRVLRIGLATYFVCIALYFRAEPIILTPELKTGLWWIPLVQLAVAVGLLFRPTVIPACAVIAAMYGYAAHLYGWVHMLDYHFFLGVLALLVLDAQYGPPQAALGLLALRLTVSTSFMWVAAEKWLYPDWTHEILSNLLPPVLSAFDIHFSCTAAGFVEFGLAFFILFGMVASHVAALVLLSLLLAAIPLVGPVDAIGHLPLVISLAILAVTKNRRPRAPTVRRSISFLGVLLLPTTLVLLLVLYFYSHEAAVAAAVFGHWPGSLSHAAFTGAAGYWVTYALYGVVLRSATRVG